MTTTRRLAIDAHRARRARPQEIELTEDFELAGGQPADASVDEVGVRAAHVALPRSRHQVLAEICYRDQSVAETARLLQIPPGSVRSRTFYGYARCAALWRPTMWRPRSGGRLVL